jgi:hypothetical protein
MRRPPAALRTFLEPYGPAIARLYFAARKAVLAEAPQANELVYDAYNALTTAYSFSDRLKEAFCHVAAYRDHVNLGFNRGAELADPARLLAGGGRAIRHVRISGADDLRRPGVRSLIRAAARQGRSLATPPAKPQATVKAVYPSKRRPKPTAKRVWRRAARGA